MLTWEEVGGGDEEYEMVKQNSNKKLKENAVQSLQLFHFRLQSFRFQQEGCDHIWRSDTSFSSLLHSKRYLHFRYKIIYYVFYTEEISCVFSWKYVNMFVGAVIYQRRACKEDTPTPSNAGKFVFAKISTGLHIAISDNGHICCSLPGVRTREIVSSFQG